MTRFGRGSPLDQGTKEQVSPNREDLTRGLHVSGLPIFTFGCDNERTAPQGAVGRVPALSRRVATRTVQDAHGLGGQLRRRVRAGSGEVGEGAAAAGPGARQRR